MTDRSKPSRKRQTHYGNSTGALPYGELKMKSHDIRHVMRQTAKAAKTARISQMEPPHD